MAHFLIEQFFKKNNIEAEKLTEEEKSTFDEWQKSLIAEPITIENLTGFIKSQKEKTENKLADPSIPKEQRFELLPYLTIYKALLGLIESPQAEKEAKEEYIKELLKQ